MNQSTPLSAHHAKMLDDSLVSLEIARQRGYRTITTPQELRDLGFADYQSRNVPGLLVPRLDADGNTTGCQYRADTPRLDSDGKAVKYDSPAGQRNDIDVPPGIGPSLAEPSTPLVITEGARKADSGASRGLTIVALAGVDAWRARSAGAAKTDPTQPVAAFDRIPLKGRDVVIAFDSDVMTKDSVRNALRRLAAHLESRGAKVRYWVPRGAS